MAGGADRLAAPPPAYANSENSPNKTSRKERTMKKSLPLLGSLFVLALAAVAATIWSGNVTPSASAASAGAAAPATTDSAKTFAVDPVHSSIIFGIKHLNVANFYGRFNDVSGSIVWDDDNPENISISIEIKAESVDTNNDGRDRHLRNPDFFNVREFQTITFKSTKVEERGESYRVTGDLDLHGVKRPITVDLKKTGSTTHPRTGKKVIGMETHFTIKRSEHRMTYGIEQNMLGDEVKLIIALEAIEE